MEFTAIVKQMSSKEKQDDTSDLKNYINKRRKTRHDKRTNKKKQKQIYQSSYNFTN